MPLWKGPFAFCDPSLLWSIHLWRMCTSNLGDRTLNLSVHPPNNGPTLPFLPSKILLQSWETAYKLHHEPHHTKDFGWIIALSPGVRNGSNSRDKSKRKTKIPRPLEWLITGSFVWGAVLCVTPWNAKIKTPDRHPLPRQDLEKPAQPHASTLCSSTSR